MKIAIDIDDTIAQFQPGFLKYHNDTYNSKKEVKDIIHYGYDKIFNQPVPEMIRRVIEFYNHPSFDEIIPMQHSQRVLNEWIKTHELYILTARPFSVEEKTRTWLHKHFPIAFKEIIFSGQYGSKDQTGVRRKEDICLELGIDLVIEDSPIHAQRIADIGIDLLLLDVPWNHGLEHDRITRVKDWLEIEAHVK